MDGSDSPQKARSRRRSKAATSEAPAAAKSSSSGTGKVDKAIAAAAADAAQGTAPAKPRKRRSQKEGGKAGQHPTSAATPQLQKLQVQEPKTLSHDDWDLATLSNDPTRRLPSQVIAPGVVDAQPPLFSHDGEFFFLPNGSSVKIFSRLTGEVVSTLAIPQSSSSSNNTSAGSSASSSQARINCLALHPLNPFRLVAGCSDGQLRTWDYTEGVLLSTTLVLPGSLAITHLAVLEKADLYLQRKEQEESSATQAVDLRQWVFVVVQKRKVKKSAKAIEKAKSANASIGDAAGDPQAAKIKSGKEEDEGEEHENSLVYAVHLRYSATASSSNILSHDPTVPRIPIRLGKTRGAAAGLKLSADGKFLACIGNKKLQIALVERMLQHRLVKMTSRSLPAAAPLPAVNGTHAEGGEKNDNMDVDASMAGKEPGSGKNRRRKQHGAVQQDKDDEATGKAHPPHPVLVDFVKFATSSHLTCLALPHLAGSTTLVTGSEDGVIRLWHNVLDEQLFLQLSKDEKAFQLLSSGMGAAALQTTDSYLPHSSLHWHAHAVRSLAYSSNDAQLLSGGEENVLVIWQIGAVGGASGNQTKKEFVPRLQAPVAAVGETQGYEGRDREYVIVLQDGSILFISAVNLKPNRIFSRLRVDATRSRLPEEQQLSIPVPLATEPHTGALVLPSSHPSALQFFNASQDRLIYELEVTPANRTFLAQEDFVEPVRAHAVAFPPQLPSSSANSASGMSEWMAVLETRNAGEGVSQEMALTFWQWRPTSDAKKGSTALDGAYQLVTRIEKPHDRDVTDLQSSAAAGRGAAPALASASLDGTVRLWGLTTALTKGAKRESFWTLRSVLTHRGCIPAAVAFSPDGALLSVAQGASVTIWDVASSSLRFALTTPDVASFQRVAFGGRGGRFIAAGGSNKIIIWDVITREAVLRHSFKGRMSSIWSKNGVFGAAIDDASSEVTSIAALNPEKGSCSIVGRTDVRLRSISPSVGPLRHSPLSIHAITESFDAIHIGPEPIAKKDAKKSRSLSSVSVAKRSLFEDLFGRDDEPTQSLHTVATSTQSSAPTSKLLDLFSAPAHLLPSMDLLFAPLITQMLPPALPKAKSSKAKASTTSDTADDLARPTTNTTLPPANEPRPGLKSGSSSKEEIAQVALKMARRIAPLNGRKSEISDAIRAKSAGVTNGTGSSGKKATTKVVPPAPSKEPEVIVVDSEESEVEESAEPTETPEPQPTETPEPNSPVRRSSRLNGSAKKRKADV